MPGRSRAPDAARVAKMAGFTAEQYDVGRLVPLLGNTYSGASPIGLTAVLDIAKPGDLVLITSFGSGAGSDSFVFRVKDRIEEVRDLAARTRPQLDENQIYVDYGTYAKLRGKIENFLFLIGRGLVAVAA